MDGGTLTNTGTITCGAGGLAGAGSFGGTNGAAGAGGAGVVGSGLSITNSGSITGGFSGDGTTQADAIQFTGGSNTLRLQNGSSLSGNIEIDGSGSVTFNQSTAQTVDNTIAGTGSVVQSGAGR